MGDDASAEGVGRDRLADGGGAPTAEGDVTPTADGGVTPAADGPTRTAGERGAPGAGLDARLEAAVESMAAHADAIWVAAILTFVVGDTATTLVGLQFVEVVETGPGASAALGSYGLVALLPLKLGAMAVAAGIWWLAPRPQNVGVPLGLAVLGTLVTAWNAVVVGTVLLARIGAT